MVKWGVGPCARTRHHQRGEDVTTDELNRYLKVQTDLRCESATRALKALISDANNALRNLQDHGYDPPSGVGGSHLNRQNYEDAERALILGWHNANLAALTEEDA
jgi:hypothetical protein